MKQVIRSHRDWRLYRAQGFQLADRTHFVDADMDVVVAAAAPPDVPFVASVGTLSFSSFPLDA